jgi:hypothetical protein
MLKSATFHHSMRAGATGDECSYQCWSNKIRNYSL